MSERQRQMLIAAQRKHGAIRPCGGHKTFSACFTKRCGKVIFWYNTPDGSTHIEVADCR